MARRPDGIVCQHLWHLKLNYRMKSIGSEEKKYLICGKLKLCSIRYPNIDNSYSSVNVKLWHLLFGLKVVSNAVKVNYFSNESESENLDTS